MNLILLFFIGITCSITIIPTYAEVSEEDGKLFDEAVQLLEQKKFQSALIKTRQFLNTNPESFEAKTNECAILLELKKLSEADECLQYTLAKRPDDVHNLSNLGGLYMLQENYEAAKTQLSITHQMYPDDITTYANLLGARLLVGEDIDQIIQEHEDLLEKNEFNVQVLVNLAKILNDNREFEKAKYFLDRAYEIDSEHVNVLEQLGVWYALQGDSQNAETYFLRSLEKDSENISVLNNLGLLFREQGDKNNDAGKYYQSIGYYESVLLLDSEDVFANIGLDYSVQKIDELYQNFYLRLYLLVIGAMGIGVVVTLSMVSSRKKLEKSLKTSTDEKRKKKIRNQILGIQVSIIFLSGFLAIAFTIIILSLVWGIPMNNGWDMATWSSTVIQIGTAIIIALVILVYELTKHEQISNDQKQISELIKSTKTMTGENKKVVEEVKKMTAESKKVVNEVRKIIKSQHEFSQNRKHEIEGRLLNVFKNILSEIDKIIKNVEEWKKGQEPDRQKYVDEIWELKEHIKLLAKKNLDDRNVISIDLFLDHEINNYKIISDLCKTDPIVYGDERNDILISHYHNLKNILPDHIEDLTKKMAKTHEDKLHSKKEDKL